MNNRRGAICLTADIHHSGMGGRDQRLAELNEIEAATIYARTVARFGISVTFFLTGRAAHENPVAIRGLGQLVSCELAGHNFAALTPWAVHFGLFRRVTGSAWRSRRHQDTDIRRTVRAFEKTLDVRPESWRNHAYAGDRHTPELLARNGIRVLSDGFRAGAAPQIDVTGVVLAPINTLPDHETVEHPPGSSPRRGRGISALDWVSQVTAEADRIVAEGRVAIILAHPLCMYLLDNFRTLNTLCAEFRNVPSVLMRDL